MFTVQYVEFFTFAGLMTVFSFILMLVAFTYEYNYFTEGLPFFLKNYFQILFSQIKRSELVMIILGIKIKDID